MSNINVIGGGQDLLLLRRRMMMMGKTKIPKVGIKTIDGQYLSTDAYHTLTDKPQAVGVYVTDYTRTIVIHPTARTRNTYCSEEQLIPGCFVSNDADAARLDFAGEANTLATIQARNDGILSSAILAIWSQNQSFLDGKKGHIPSLGECRMLNLKDDDINAALTEIDGSILTVGGNYGTSSQHSIARIWRYNFPAGSVIQDRKSGYYNVFAIYQEPYAL